MQIELRLGDSQRMIVDEFPEMGAVSRSHSAAPTAR
jgi:hypothetical protein